MSTSGSSTIDQTLAPNTQTFYKKKTQKKKDKETLISNVLTEKTEAHIIETGQDETLTAADGDMISVPLVDPIFDDVYDCNMHYDTSRMCEWLAGTGSTSHIARTRELFSTYETTRDATVICVGGKQTKVEGCGTVILTARYGNTTRSLRLERVNHIPSNKYNVMSLGLWDIDGRSYRASQGELTLYN